MSTIIPKHTPEKLAELVHEAANTASLLGLQEKILEDRLNEIRTEHAERIANAKAVADSAHRELAGYCLINRLAVFGTKQSVKVNGHGLSFKMTPPKVTLAPGTTEADVIAKLEAAPPQIRAEIYLQRTVELNKDAVKKWWEPNADFLTRCGLQRSQSERFHFAPAKAETTTTNEGGN